MKKLLVVDDEDKIREVIKEYAEFSGYEAVSYTHLTLPTNSLV